MANVMKKTRERERLNRRQEKREKKAARKAKEQEQPFPDWHLREGRRARKALGLG